MPTDNRVTSRRGFLDICLGAGVIAWLASLIYPVLRYLRPLPSAGPSGPTRLTRSEIEKLETQSFVIVPAGSKRLMVFKDSAGALHALDAKCTHEGCTVQFLPGESIVWCACHNGRFATDGRVLSGPPPRPLARYEVHQDEQGNVLVNPVQA
ncbi:MAG: Rieske (2Fe-2S) protein [Planctomycetota bacterium]